MSEPVVQVEETGKPAGQSVALRLPDPAEIFSRRAARLTSLASGHPMEEYLLFVAALARVQHQALEELGNGLSPGRSQPRQQQAPPFAVLDRRPGPVWRSALGRLLDALREGTNPVARQVMERLRRADGQELRRVAENLLGGNWSDLDLAAVPLVGAALQVEWVGLASTLEAGSLQGGGLRTLCPVCASAPVASVVRGKGSEKGRRYLHCCLCGSEWYFVRAICSNCAATDGIAYYTVDKGPQAIRAETCATCRGYLKVMDLGENPEMDPTADDLASLPLDVLVGQEDVLRSGTNFFVLPAVPVDS